MEAHSRLSASAAHRWLECPGSVALSESLPDQTSAYAEEGTRAHEICAADLHQALADPGWLARQESFPTEMENLAFDYAHFVLARRIQGSTVLVEHRVDYSRFIGVPDSFGTADCLILRPDGLLCVVDFKYGQGVRVEAENNPQMMLYALGAYAAFGALYDIDRVEMSIYQPRLGNASSCELGIAALLAAADRFKEAAQAAVGKDAALRAGDWCRFCKARNVCRARAEANLRSAREDFALPPVLSDEEIAALLPKLDQLAAWCRDLQDYALQQALQGRKIEGYKLVYGRSVRRFSDTEAVAAAVKNLGLNPYKAPELLGITEMQNLLGGRKKFDETLGAWIVKPQGKPTLVPESDKRPATAVSDFTEKR